jgi:hypothetical protein
VIGGLSFDVVVVVVVLECVEQPNLYRVMDGFSVAGPLKAKHIDQGHHQL